MATGLSVQSPASVAVVIDATAESADAADSTRLRQQSLEGIAGPGSIYFELTPDTARRVPDDERDAFSRTTFDVRGPRYNGLALTVNEAVEILRGNESLRDGIIARECGNPTRPDCGGWVRAAATARVAEAEAASRKKLRRLVETLRANPAALVVLVSAGWPYRDERGIGLADALRDLRAVPARLVVVRVPSPTDFGGLIRDAAETLASRLSADFITVSDDADAEVANRRLSRALRVEAPQAAPPPSPVPVAAPSPAIGAQTPSETRNASPADGPSIVTGVPDALRSAARYVDHLERTLSSVVWRERSLQEVRVPRKFSSSGARSMMLAARRAVDSEMFFLWLPDDATWIAVRDVVALDGQARPAGERRLQALLAGAEISMRQLRVLAAENGRFDIGSIRRTFSEPTLVLLFLDAHYRQRFTFTPGATTRVGRAEVRSWTFVERGRPTVIRHGDQDMAARGSFKVDAASGQVLETALELQVPSAELSGEVRVRFGPHPRFDVLVPLEMRETYANGAGERITTVSAYSDFRRFATAGRMVQD